MRVAPKQFVFAVVNVTVVDIDAAHETVLSVDNNNFAMVTIIHPIGQHQYSDFIKRINFDARRAKFFCHSLTDAVSGKIVVYKPHGHAFASLSYQNVFDAIADFVVGIDVIFDMNMVSGLFQNIQNFGKFCFAVNQ